jgi:5'-phosphate synthase pdxT subunit
MLGGAPVLVRQGRLLAAAFHPELTADRRVHRLFADMCAATSSTGDADGDEGGRVGLFAGR